MSSSDPSEALLTQRITVKALVTSNIIQSVCLVGKGRLKERCGLEPQINFFFFRLRNRQKLVRIRFENIWYTYLPLHNGMAPIKNFLRAPNSNSCTAVSVCCPFVAYVLLMSLTSRIFWYHKIISNEFRQNTKGPTSTLPILSDLELVLDYSYLATVVITLL